MLLGYCKLLLLLLLSPLFKVAQVNQPQGPLCWQATTGKDARSSGHSHGGLRQNDALAVTPAANQDSDVLASL
jgi:hypothetical protein